jgi:hypothetical protein
VLVKKKLIQKAEALCKGKPIATIVTDASQGSVIWSSPAAKSLPAESKTASVRW